MSLAVYLVVGALAWMAVPWVQRTFILPPLFVTVARGALVVGVPLVTALAWRYPAVGSDPEG